MDHKLWTMRAVVALLLAFMVAGCGTPSVPGTATPTIDSGGEGPDILGPEEALRVDAETYAKKFGVTVEEAIQRLQYQEGIGELNAALRENEADTFGGLWIEHEPRYRVVALFTRNGERTIKPYLEGKPFADLVEVRRARYSLAELEEIYAQATAELQKLDFEVNILLDEKDNRVEVPVSDRGWFKSEMRKAGVKLPKGVVVTVVEGGSTAKDKDLLLTPPVPGIAFPRQKPVEGFRMCMMALLVGTLRLEGECLYMESVGGDSHVVPIWPPEYTLRKEGDDVLVINGKGEVAARVGEEVSMSGGGGTPDEWVMHQIPAACQGGYFITCEARPNLNTDSELFTVEVISDTQHTALFLHYLPALDEQITEPVSIEGRLAAYDYLRCLHVETDMGGGYTLFWPEDWTARIEDGIAVVLDGLGEVVARVGDQVHLQGRAIPPDIEFPAYMQLVNELPGDCVGAGWLVDGRE